MQVTELFLILLKLPPALYFTGWKIASAYHVGI